MINPFLIIKETEQYFNLKAGSIVLINKKQSISVARKLAMYLVWGLNSATYSDIAEYFDRDVGQCGDTIRKMNIVITYKKDLKLLRAFYSILDKFINYM